MSDARAGAASVTNGSADLAWLRWAGWAGVAGSVAYVATFVLSTGGAEPPDGPADMRRYLADAGDAEVTGVLYGIAGVALCALFVPLALALPRLLRDRPAARAGSVAVLAGLAVLVPAYVLSATVTVGLVNAGDALGREGVDSLFGIYEVAQPATELFFWAGSFLSLGVGPLLWGLAARRGDELTGWVRVLAIATGALGFVWLIPPSGSGAVTLVIVANALASLVLFAALSLRLARASELDVA